jgi:hypothetical protein
LRDCCSSCSLEPGRRLQLLERLACIDQEGFRVIAALPRHKPFGVLELSDGDVEDKAELAEQAAGGSEAVFDSFVIAGSRIEASVQPRGVGAQERSELAGVERFRDRDQLLCFVEVGEVEPKSLTRLVPKRSQAK